MPPLDAFTGPLWGLLGCLVLPYVLAPIAIHSRHRVARLSRSRPIDFQHCSPEVARYLQDTAARLRADGFQPEAFLVSTTEPSTQSYLALLTHRAAGDKAMVAVIVSRNGNLMTSTAYFEFTTTYENGWHFDTLNASTLGAFRIHPQSFKAQLPDVEDPRRLYQIHRYLLAKHPVDSPKKVYPEGTAEEYLSSVLIKSWEEQVQVGWMSFDPREDVYRLTWKGAYLVTWGLLFPVKSLRTWRMRAKGRALLKDFAKSAGPAGGQA